MQFKNFLKKIIVFAVLLLLVLSSFSGCAGSSANPDSSDASESTGQKNFTTIDDLNGCVAGVIIGSMEELAIETAITPLRYEYYNSLPDCLTALNSGKIDFFAYAEMGINEILKTNDDFTILNEPLLSQELGFVFAKGEAKNQKLFDELNEFIDAGWDDGFLQSVKDAWMNDVEKALEDYVPYELTGENGTITVAMCSTIVPVWFVSNGEIVGSDMQVLNKFCHDYGYDMKLLDSEFSSIIPAVASGKADLGASIITLTEDRAEAVDFSHTYMYTHTYPIVRKADAASNGIKESFYRTFVLEDRWKLIAQGVLSTVKITLSAIFAGGLLGFAAFLLCRKSKRVLKRIFDFLAWLIGGLPMVVILMIMYYIIFSEARFNGETVAIIAFTISMMLSVYSLLTVAVKSIDNGQIEGAYSLGFTKGRTLFNVILPQAMVQFMPNFKDRAVELVQGTAVVGYIAVQDLTKMSDIIRARTFEAFFPLISTALIYLLLIAIMTLIIKRIQFGFDPKKRTKGKILAQYEK